MYIWKYCVIHSCCMECSIHINYIKLIDNDFISMFLLIFWLLLLSIAETNALKSPIIIVSFPVYPCSSVSFCSRYFAPRCINIINDYALLMYSVLHFNEMTFIPLCLNLLFILILLQSLLASVNMTSIFLTTVSFYKYLCIYN